MRHSEKPLALWQKMCYCCITINFLNFMPYNNSCTQWGLHDKRYQDSYANSQQTQHRHTVKTCGSSVDTTEVIVCGVAANEIPVTTNTDVHNATVDNTPQRTWLECGGEVGSVLGTIGSGVYAAGSAMGSVLYAAGSAVGGGLYTAGSAMGSVFGTIGSGVWNVIPSIDCTSLCGADTRGNLQATKIVTTPTISLRDNHGIVPRGYTRLK